MANFFAQFHDPAPDAGPSGDAVQSNYFARFHPDGAPTEQGSSFNERFSALGDQANKPTEKKFGLGDTWPAKLAKTLYSAVTLPGDVAQGNVSMVGEDGHTNPEVIGRAFDLAGAITPGSIANKVIPQATSEAAAPSIGALKSAASAGYEGPELTGLIVKPAAITDFGQKVGLKLNEAGFDDNLAPKTFGVLKNLGSAPADAVVTGNNIKSIRKMLGNAASSADPTERKAASIALEQLDAHIPNIESKDVIAGDPTAAAQALDTANANYSAAKHAETIDNKTVQAELRAAAANSGANVANTVRQRMADILIKPDLQKGFTPEELSAMEGIVRGSKAQNVIRAAGNVLGGGGGLGSVAAGFAGSVAAGPMGSLAPVLGYTLKSISNKMTLNDAAKLSEMIRSRAPLASAAQKFEEKAADFSGARNGKTIAAVSLAARNFASNLQSSGINISSSDLMRGLQLSGTGRADEQQQIPGPPGQ